LTIAGSAKARGRVMIEKRPGVGGCKRKKFIPTPCESLVHPSNASEQWTKKVDTGLMLKRVKHLFNIIEHGDRSDTEKGEWFPYALKHGRRGGPYHFGHSGGERWKSQILGFKTPTQLLGWNEAWRKKKKNKAGGRSFFFWRWVSGGQKKNSQL